MNWPDDSLYEQPYARLLAGLLDEGFVLRPLSTEPGFGIVQLRHDVEFDVAIAKRMAGAESSLGVQSTYFIAIRSPFFNVLDMTVARMIRDIHELGHEIGLHFIGDLSPVDLARRIDDDIVTARRVLELADISLVSIHTPGDLDRLRTLLADRHFSIYRRVAQHTQQYVSDSGGSWGTSLRSALTKQSAHGVQLLTHPHWWRGFPVSAMERLAELSILTGRVGLDPRLEGFTPSLWRTAHSIRNVNAREG